MTKKLTLADLVAKAVKDADKPKKVVTKKVIKKKAEDDKKNMSNDVDKKQGLIDSLEMLRKKEVANKETWKARAYLTVIKQLKTLNKPVKTIDDLQDIKGIGKGLKDKITEYIETGSMHQLADYNADGSIKAISDLMRVHGIGAVKAKELVEKYDIKSIDMLKDRQDLLNDIQKMGLKYWEDFEKRIPRKEMEKHETFILNIVKSVDPALVATITGSYRRKLPDSGDIDVLITHPNDPEDYEEIFKKVVDKLKKSYIKDVFALGGKKCMAVCKLPRFKCFRRLDLLYTKKHEYPFALAYFTGSGEFNVKLRNIALAKGYSLSEYGLKHNKGENKGEFVDVEFLTEEDIFKFLGQEYIKPEDRNPNVLDKKT